MDPHAKIAADDRFSGSYPLLNGFDSDVFPEIDWFSCPFRYPMRRIFCSLSFHSVEIGLRTVSEPPLAFPLSVKRKMSLTSVWWVVKIYATKMTKNKTDFGPVRSKTHFYQFHSFSCKISVVIRKCLSYP